MNSGLILLTDYCEYCKIEYAFIERLEDEGLIEVRVIAEERFVDEETLRALDQFRRWHYEMDINIEGMDAMRYLLEKINRMDKEINDLKTRLKLHE